MTSRRLGLLLASCALAACDHDNQPGTNQTNEADQPAALASWKCPPPNIKRGNQCIAPTPGPTPTPSPTPSPTPTPTPTPTPPPPPPVQCPDGTTVPAGQTCPVPPPSPPPSGTQWVPAPLADGGFAQCNTVGGCHSITAPCPRGLNPAALCSYPDIVAAQGDVRLYMWVGCSPSFSTPPIPYTACRYIGGFWPIGQYQQALVGVEAWVDEWGGVVPVASGSAAPTLARIGTPRQLARLNIDNRYEAVAVRTCLTPNPQTGSTSMAMSGVHKGQHYIASTLWVPPLYKKGEFVGAKPLPENHALGTAVVRRTCLKAVTKIVKLLPANSRLMPALAH